MSDLLIKDMEMPKSCYKCPFRRRDGMDIVCPVAHERFSVADVNILDYRLVNCPLVPVPPHGRLIDAEKIGLTNFEIILCQKGDPFKNALEMLLEKIENAPTIIQADGKDIKVPIREEEV